MNRFYKTSSLAFLFLLSQLFSLLPISIAANSDTLIFKKPIKNDNINLGEIEIYEGEEPADVVYVFGEERGLNGAFRNAVLDQICQSVKCSRREALLWSTPVSKDGELVGTIEIFEGVEPVDAVYDFVRKYNLTDGYRNAILKEACEVVECHRVEPVIWRKAINMSGSLVTLEIKEGEELADSIFQFLQPYGVPYDDRRKIIELAKNDGIHFSREHALVLSQNITMENKTMAGTIDFYDDGGEPIDVIHRFITEHDLQVYSASLKDSMLPRICSLLLCRRAIPKIWAQNISTENGKVIGPLEILLDQEPVDAVDQFVQMHGLNIDYRNNILQTVCNDITCERTVPVVYRKDVNDENGKSIGAVEVLEGEEVVDAVVRFLRKSKTPLDHIAMKNYFFSHACNYPRLKCTRNVAIVFNRKMNREDGSAIGQLVIHENEEPADVIYKWSFDHGLGENYVFNIINIICDTEGMICNRDAPLIFGPQPISGPDGLVGNLEVKLRQEPVDALYGFFSKYGLFEKEWDFPGVFQQVCAFPGLVGKCQRAKAVKFYDTNFTIGEVDVGQVVIWQDEEVVDVLYAIRKQFNLTLEDQMSSVTMICGKPEVYCTRSRAVVYRITDINYNDYDRFGNETCHRKYAGWQFIASIAETTLGGKLAEVVKKDEVKKVIESPLFGSLVIWTIFVVLQILLYCPKMRKMHKAQKLVVYLAVFGSISYFYARMVEPMDEIDTAMHLFEGKLPDLEIFEEEEPADAIMQWGKEASRKHHPVIRENIHLSLLSKVCDESGKFNCTRRRAWEKIDMGSITLSGVKHDIAYYNPEVDPRARKKCKPIMDGKTDTCLQESAAALCRRLQPPVPNCLEDITLHMASQMKGYEEKRLDSKNTYTKLSLEMDVTNQELFEKVGSLVRKYGQNFVPYARVDNGTAVYTKWDKNTHAAWAVRDAYHKVKDPESREFNDKPCEPVFGGALCAKTDKDGNMIIEC